MYAWDLNELNASAFAPRDNAPRPDYTPEEAASFRRWQERQEAQAAADTEEWERPDPRWGLALLGGTPEVVWPAEDEPLQAQPFRIPPRAPGLPPVRRARRVWLVVRAVLIAVAGWIALAAVLSGGWR